jgi:hypothetical protein
LSSRGPVSARGICFCALLEMCHAIRMHPIK